MPNRENGGLENTNDFPDLANRLKPEKATENAGAAGTATGVKGIDEVAKLRRDITSKSRRSTMSKYIQPAHKSASRMLGYALTLNDAFGWEGAALVFGAFLCQRERLGLAYAALEALRDDELAGVLDFYARPNFEFPDETRDMTAAIKEAAQAYRATRERRQCGRRSAA